MKHIIIALGIIILFSYSCKKEDVVVDIVDEFVYVDLVPNLVLHPCDTFGQIPNGFEIIPSPLDSSVNVSIDINQDGIDDFIFYYSTYYEMVSQSRPEANYNSTVSILGLYSGNKVIVDKAHNLDLDMMAFGDSIDQSKTLFSNGDVFRDNVSAPYGFWGFSGDGYIGLKLTNGEYAWIKINLDISTYTFTILEYAYNKKHGSRITAGQIE